ncbi:hypothetical protein thalar_00147 [Litoreibacter arenae DSM 19593]|uniref:Uncharacterized protein n=1 Tax=Litoreibacter arenae DSM 19593 TaxID=1123360 RepID=S9QPP4_9RHOB|nr:hypothetical protein thalar_00147 [Litoreibacter arenae DSM 19593]
MATSGDLVSKTIEICSQPTADLSKKLTELRGVGWGGLSGDLRPIAETFANAAYLTELKTGLTVSATIRPDYSWYVSKELEILDQLATYADAATPYFGYLTVSEPLPAALNVKWDGPFLLTCILAWNADISVTSIGAAEHNFSRRWKNNNPKLMQVDLRVWKRDTFGTHVDLDLRSALDQSLMPYQIVPDAKTSVLVISTSTTQVPK